MRKKELLKLIKKKKMKKSKTFCIYLLIQFLNSEAIAKLDKNADISFLDYLQYMEANTKLNKIDLFKPPYLEENSPEYKVLNTFLNAEPRKTALVFESSPAFELKTLKSVQEPACGMTMLSNKQIVTSTCYYDKDAERLKGNTILRDGTTGQPIEKLSNEPASTVAFHQGVMLTGTCYYNKANGYVQGELRFKDKKGMTNVIEKPAAGIAFFSDGYMIISTCFYNEHLKGSIDLYNAQGDFVKNLSTQPASGIVMLEDGNFITSTCYYDKEDDCLKGNIKLRDPFGSCIKKLFEVPASCILLENGEFIIGTSYYDKDTDRLEGSITFTKPQLSDKSINTPFIDRIYALAINKPTNACFQFQKGVEKPNPGISALCFLPAEILFYIYTFVFPYPEQKSMAVINPHCDFPYFKPTDTTEVLLAREFAKKIFRIGFFSSAKPSNDQRIEEKPTKQQQRKTS